MTETGWRARARSASRVGRFGALLSATVARWEVDRRRLPKERHEARKEELRHEVSGRILRIFGVRVVSEGSVALATRPRLVVSNHRAALDIGVLLHEVGGVFLSRSDLADWPVVGRLAREADTIFVDREDRGSGAAAIRAMRRRLKTGASVMIFPEGATHVGDEVRPFHAGAFVAARGIGAEIVPVGLAYPPGVEYVGVSFAEHIDQLARRPETVVGVSVGAPFDADGKPAEMAARAHAEVDRLVGRARELASRSQGLARLDRARRSKSPTD